MKEKISQQLVNEIIVHLSSAQIQRAPSDDRIIAGKIDHALMQARTLSQLLMDDE